MTEVDVRLGNIERRQDTFEATVRAYMEAQKQRDDDFRAEMRDRDNQRAAEIREIRQSQEAMRKDMYAVVDRMDQKIDGIGKFVQNLTIATMVGIGAVVVGVVAIAVAVIVK